MPTIANVMPDFKEEYLRSNRFEISMADDRGNWYTKKIIKISLPTVNFTDKEWWDGTAFTRMVASGVFGDIDMEVYLSEQSSPFFDWINQQVQHIGRFDTSKIKVAKITGSYKKDIVVKQYNGKFKLLYQWKMIGCQLASASFTQLNYEADGEIMRGSLKIRVDKVLLPNKNNVSTDGDVNSKWYGNSINYFDPSDVTGATSLVDNTTSVPEASGVTSTISLI